MQHFWSGHLRREVETTSNLNLFSEILLNGFLFRLNLIKVSRSNYSMLMKRINIPENSRSLYPLFIGHFHFEYSIIEISHVVYHLIKQMPLSSDTAHFLFFLLSIKIAYLNLQSSPPPPPHPFPLPPIPICLSVFLKIH